MSTDFTTPGRASVSGTGGGSSRRVMRSALEALLETQSPLLQSPTASEGTPPVPQTATSQRGRERGQDERESTGKAQAPHRRTTDGRPGNPPVEDDHPSAFLTDTTHRTTTGVPKGFTVSYAAKSSGAASAPAQETRRATSVPATVMPPTGHVHHREEPSALLFLSPADDGGHADDGRYGPRAATKAKPTRITDSRPEMAASGRARSQPLPTTPSPDASRSLLPDVELATEGRGEASEVPPKRTRTTTQHVDPSWNTAPLFSEAEVQRRVAEALAAYEKRRDDEEMAVLKQIDQEIGEKEKTNRQLMSEKEEVMAVAKSLQAQLTSVVQQCEALQHEQQDLRDALSRAEVDLCHTKDALREKERAGAQEEGLVEALQSEVTTLKEAVATKEAALAEAQQQYLAEGEDIKHKMLALGECMSAMEETLAERDTTIAQLRKRVEEAEKGKAASSAAVLQENHTLTAQVKELQDALQAQTDEVRRRMAKVAAFEKELKSQKQRTRELEDALVRASDHQDQQQTLLENLLADVKAQVRTVAAIRSEKSSQKAKATDAAKHASLSAASTPSPPQTALDRTNPFSCSSRSSSEGDGEASADSVEDGDNAAAEETHHPNARQSRHRNSAAPRIAKLLFTEGRPNRKSVGRRAISAPLKGSVTTSARPQSTSTPDTTDATLTALRHGCAACARVARELGSVMGVYTRRVRRRLAAVQQETERRTEEAQTAEALTQRLEAACRYLKTKLAEKEKVLSQTTAECEAMAKDLEQLEAEVHEASQERQALAVLVKEHEAAKSEADTAHATLEQEVLQLHAQLQSASALVKTREETITALETKLTVAEAAAAAVPALEEAKRGLEEALSKEEAAGRRLTARLSQAEDSLASAQQQSEDRRAQLDALRAELDALQTQQTAHRAKESRDAQHAAAEAKRLGSALDSVKAECSELRVRLAKERASAEEAYKVKDEHTASLTDAVRTSRAQVAELVREMELRRCGEHATLQAILDAVGSAMEEDDPHDSGDLPPQGAPSSATGTPSRSAHAGGGTGDGDSPSPSAAGTLDVSTLSPLEAGAGKSLGSTQGAGVRVSLLADGLSTVKRRRKGSAHEAAAPAGPKARKKSTALLRKEAVQAVQRTVLALARLQEVTAQTAQRDHPVWQEGRQGPTSGAAAPTPSTGVRLLESFERAERMAREAAQRSTQRGLALPSGERPGNSPLPVANLFGGTMGLSPEGLSTGPSAEEDVDLCFDTHFSAGRAPQLSRPHPPTPWQDGRALSAASRSSEPLPQNPHPFGQLPLNSFLNARGRADKKVSERGPPLSPAVSLEGGHRKYSSSRSNDNGLPRSPSGEPNNRGAAGQGGGDVDGSCSPSRPPELRMPLVGSW